MELSDYKKNSTTIVISKKTRAKIEKLKDHPRQTCDEIIDDSVSGALLRKEKKK